MWDVMFRSCHLKFFSPPFPCFPLFSYQLKENEVIKDNKNSKKKKLSYYLKGKLEHLFQKKKSEVCRHYKSCLSAQFCWGSQKDVGVRGGGPQHPGIRGRSPGTYSLHLPGQAIRIRSAAQLPDVPSDKPGLGFSDAFQLHAYSSADSR